MDFNGNKGFRLLDIYERLNKGEVLSKARLADDYNVTEKTIQRDIDDLRAYLAETHFTEKETTIKYNKSKNGYCLVRLEHEWLTNQEILAVCKILIESRAFRPDEMKPLVSKLMLRTASENRSDIENIIRKELYNYVPLRHNKKLLAPIWELSRFVLRNEIIAFSYVRKDGVKKEHRVKPVAVMFSEYYFYLIAYMADDSKKCPTVFRIDRITNIKGTGKNFFVPYKDKFDDGEFRKRVQFMYSGELRRVTFKYKGQSVESVLYRLPTAEILSEDNGVYTIRVEVFGSGIDMWLKSQGDNVEVM